MKKVKILDCTLRDGGYYNRWDFPIDLVRAYLKALAEAVDIIELGFRQFGPEEFLGPHAFTTHSYLKRLELPPGPMYGVMVDAKNLTDSGLSIEKAVDALFQSAPRELFDLVRVAAHFTEVADALQIVRHLKSKGFTVGLNLMQASLQGDNAIRTAAEAIAACDELDVLYFADSLGDMQEEDIRAVFVSLREGGWQGEIGFHAHNNIGLGLVNVDVAACVGCSWLDSTVTGMGRGAGNAETEFVLLHHRSSVSQACLESLGDLVVRWFQPLKIKHGWGTSLFYRLGAQRKLHPTYIQQLAEDNDLGPADIIRVINDLGRTESPHKYKTETLESCVARMTSSDAVAFSGETGVDAVWQDREVVLVANTPTSNRLEDAILDYAEHNHALLCSINLPAESSSLKHDFIFVSHNRKIREDASRYAMNKYKFIAPKKAFAGEKINIAYDYGLQVTENEFVSTSNCGRIPFHLTVAYALAFCSVAQAKQVSLVGFDGHLTESAEHKQMAKFWGLFQSSCDLTVVSLTPTPYPLAERSIYAL